MKRFIPLTLTLAVCLSVPCIALAADPSQQDIMGAVLSLSRGILNNRYLMIALFIVLVVGNVATLVLLFSTGRAGNPIGNLFAQKPQHRRKELLPIKKEELASIKIIEKEQGKILRVLTRLKEDQALLQKYFVTYGQEHRDVADLAQDHKDLTDLVRSMKNKIGSLDAPIAILKRNLEDLGLRTGSE